MFQNQVQIFDDRIFATPLSWKGFAINIYRRASHWILVFWREKNFLLRPPCKDDDDDTHKHSLYGTIKYRSIEAMKRIKTSIATRQKLNCFAHGDVTMHQLKNLYVLNIED